MARIVILKNTSGTEVTINGQTFAVDEAINISDSTDLWKNDSETMAAIGNGTLVVNDGTNDLPPIEGWNWVEGQTSPYSHLGNKLSVHASASPQKEGKVFYLVWTGAGDDLATHTIGGGEMLQFHLLPGISQLTKRIQFDPTLGDVYLHEGYAKWTGGSYGDHVIADIIATPTLLQTSANLDLIVENNIVKYSPQGPGTGTHGFAANPVLIPRYFSKDGFWDYNQTDGLTPNMAGTGEYNISDVEQVVHRYMNKIPTFGDSAGYALLTSDETAFMPPGYCIDITVFNVSDGDWSFNAFLEVYRQKTI